MNPYRIKRGDTGPPFLATLLDADGEPVDISGASLLFKARDHKTKATVISAAMAIVDGPAGRVRYVWQAADTASARFLDAEVEVTLVGGEVQTFPNGWGGDQFIRVEVVEDVGP